MIKTHINYYKSLLFLIGLTTISHITACTGRAPINHPLPGKTPTITMAVENTITPALMNNHIIELCINNSSGVAFSDWQIDGHVFLDGPDYLLDLQNGSINHVSDISEPVFSPNGSYMAYYDMKEEKIIIADPLNKEITDILNSEGFSPAQWLNNDYMTINRYIAEFDFESLLIINPFTNDKRELLPEYPGFRYNFPPAFQWEGYFLSKLVPNQTVSHLVYPNEDFELVLWDLEKDVEVQHLYRMDFDNTPWWSPDGTRFITSVPIKQKAYDGSTLINIDDGLSYVGGNELVTVDLQGNKKRLTYFTTERKAKEFRYIWSPDGRKVAFWLQLGDQSDWDFAILDTKTEEVINYCIHSSAPFWIYWSTDGNHLATTIGISELKYETVIIDIIGNSIYKIAENAIVRGWMK
jgi:hypothetical protein